jgi:hypothetical protein
MQCVVGLDLHANMLHLHISLLQLAPEESESAWQKVDYKLMPHVSGLGALAGQSDQ